MLGKLNDAEIEEVLKAQVLGRIGCHADDITYIVPVSYAYDGCFVYACSKNGLKIDIMRKNPKICFEVESLRDMANWKTVVAWGTFEEITDSMERSDALQKLNKRQLPVISSETTHLWWQWPFEPADLNSIEGIVYRLRLTGKTGRFESMSGAGSVSNPYFCPGDTRY